MPRMGPRVIGVFKGGNIAGMSCRIMAGVPSRGLQPAFSLFPVQSSLYMQISRRYHSIPPSFRHYRDLLPLYCNPKSCTELSVPRVLPPLSGSATPIYTQAAHPLSQQGVLSRSVQAQRCGAKDDRSILEMRLRLKLTVTITLRKSRKNGSGDAG